MRTTKKPSLSAAALDAKFEAGEDLSAYLDFDRVTTSEREAALHREVADLKRTLASLIAWMAQSAGSPISLTDAKALLRMLEGGDE